MAPEGGAHGEFTLSVVICAYTEERWSDIERAIASVQAQPEVVQVVLVIDYNEPLLARAVEAFPTVVVVPNAETQGLSGSRNTGVQRCTGGVVAFLDDDAAAADDWALRLLAPYRDDSSVIGVGGRVEPNWRAPRPSWLPDEFLWVVGCSYLGQPTGRAEVRNGIGANLSFRRDVLASVGGFDPTVGRIGKDAAGCEETELSIRARRAFPGGRIVLEPTAVCWHAVTSDRVTRSYFRRRCQAEGRSKAVVSGLVGSGAALKSERAYVRSVLPAGVLRGFRDAARGDASAVGRSLAVIEGLFLTASTYVGSLVAIRAAKSRT